MSQFVKTSNPYNPGYALPKNVQAEGVRRGTLVTAWTPKGTIAPTPLTVPPWKTGYAVPPNVLREPLGRGTLVTAWSPRGSINTLAPDTFARTTLTSGQFGSLGDTPSSEAASGNPFAEYGRRAAAIVMRASGGNPQTMKAILDKVDPKVWANVKRNPSQSQIAAALANGIAKEMVNLGLGKRPHSQKQISLAGRVGMGGIWGSITGGIKDAVNKIGSLGCQVANNPLTPAAAAGVSSAYGSGPQTGVAGAAVAQSLCAKAPPVQPVSFMERSPSWLIPVALGGGALLLIIALRK